MKHHINFYLSEELSCDDEGSIVMLCDECVGDYTREEVPFWGSGDEECTCEICGKK